MKITACLTPKAATVLPRFWTSSSWPGRSRSFLYDGKYYNFKNITVAPKPLQKPYPPIRIAAASPDTYPSVGERGLPIFINARYGSFSEFAPEIRAYRDAYSAAGHEGRGQVYLRVPTYLAETEDRAREEPRESLMHFYREQAQRLRDSLSRAGTRAIEGRAERLKRIENLTYEEALQGQVLVGTPDEVTERLRSCRTSSGSTASWRSSIAAASFRIGR